MLREGGSTIHAFVAKCAKAEAAATATATEATAAAAAATAVAAAAATAVTAQSGNQLAHARLRHTR